MKNIKFIIAIIMIMAITLASFAACSPDNSGDTSSQEVSKEQPADAESSVDASSDAEPSKDETSSIVPEDVTIRIAGMTGPTYMGMAKLMEDSANGITANKYDFSEPYTTADQFASKFVKGDYDIVSIPANLAAKLNINTNGKVKVLAVNTLGVLYIVAKGETVDSLESLKGKTVYCTGMGSVPEYTLRYLLSQNNIDADKDINIVWKSSADEIVATIGQEENCIAMLPQPFVTKALQLVEGLEIQLSLTDEWKKLDNGSELITSVIVVKEDFAQKYPNAVAVFMQEVESSIEYVNANNAEAGELIGKYNIAGAPIATKALPYCNLVFIDGEEMQAMLLGYLDTLYSLDPDAVGGKEPDDSLFYEAE